MDKSFNLLDYSIAFHKPRRLTDVDFWHLHIPFAFMMVAMLKPERFVELGTHKGDSYCAFCQAVDELGLNTACYAVDSWQGDEQTGFYGEEVLEELRAYHDPLYGGFSSLMKCLFDDALGYFSEGSIDLLHIDGHHTYDSVRHDFESWLPKMSERGIVLFHDTNVREREFGVWRLWNEISGQYPSFEFKFGNGLGVLAVGESVEKKVQAFFESGKANEAAVTNLFYDLGRNILLASENKKIVIELNYLIDVRAELNQNLIEKDKQLKQADEWLKEWQSMIQNQQVQIQNQQVQIQNQQVQIETKDRLLQEIFASKGWKWLTRYRGVKQKMGFLNPGKHKKKDITKVKSYHVRIIHPIQRQRPKIVHAIANLMTGGSSRLIVDLIEHLGHKYDQEVITYFIPTPPAYTGFTFHDFSGPVTAEDIEAFLRNKGASILHVHYWGECDKPWYNKVFKAAENCSCAVIENINTPVASYVHDIIDHYVYVSEYAMNYTTPVPEKASVIYPGSNLTMFQRNGAPIPDDTIGMVYRLESDKLRKDSIQVFIEVVKKRPKTKVYIVGGGTFLNSYKKQVVDQGAAENFVFTGNVAYERLPEYYKKFSLFVAPVWKESFGQVSSFAMSMKIPVVGYNVGALSEILGSSEFLGRDTAELTEIIIKLLDDRKKRVEIGNSNYSRVCNLFLVEGMVSNYDRLYENLLSEHK